MTAAWHDGIFLGITVPYHMKFYEALHTPINGYMESELVYSYDGEHFMDTTGRPLVERPSPPLQGCAQTALVDICESFDGTEYILTARGFNVHHSMAVPEMIRLQNGRAFGAAFYKIRKDGFCGIEGMGGGAPGLVLTRRLLLLKDDLSVMLNVLGLGQRIVWGLLDSLKLYLTQVGYMFLLILAFIVLRWGMPYEAAQGSYITIFTLTLPAIGLSLWARKRRVSAKEMGKRLRWFVIPAAPTIMIAALAVFALFDQTAQVRDYAQLATAFFLVVTGLVLVVFAKPPASVLGDGSHLRGDWRPVFMVLGLYIFSFAVLAIPLARQAFGVGSLLQPSEYGSIWAIAAIWALALQIIWWIWRLIRSKTPPWKAVEPPAEAV